MSARDGVAAEEIAEDLLYRSGKAMDSGDFELFMTCFELPKTLETAHGRRIIATASELRGTFDAVIGHLAEERVTDLVRTVIEARFVDDATISYTHVAALMREGGASTRKPYPVHSVARLRDGAWRVVSSTYAILDSDAHNRALSGGV